MTAVARSPTGVHSASPRAPLRCSPRHCATRGIPSMDCVDDPQPLDRPHHAHATYAYVGGAARCDYHAGLLSPVISVITITGIGDHLQPEWLITSLRGTWYKLTSG